MLPDNLARKLAVFATDASLSLVHSLADPLVEAGAPTGLGDWMETAEADFIGSIFANWCCGGIVSVPPR
jgi:hypothetical protein